MQAFRRYLAEFIGTFIVVFIAAGAIVADVFLTRTRLADSFGPLGIIAAYGLAVALAMLVVMPVSGAHLNPVISISAYVARRLSFSEAAGYVLAQVAGAIVAAFLLRAIMPKSAFDFASGGVPGVATGIKVVQATAVEVVLTFFLTFTFWAVLIDERGPRVLAPFAVGLVIIAGGLAGSAFTGAAMNPADVLTIHTDGAARGNPGPAAYAVVITRPGQPPVEEAATLGSATNNVAEYTALVRGLERAADLGLKRLAVFSDSELLVKQMYGEYKVKNPDLKELHGAARDLLKHLWQEMILPKARGLRKVEVVMILRSCAAQVTMG